MPPGATRPQVVEWKIQAQAPAGPERATTEEIVAAYRLSRYFGRAADEVEKTRDQPLPPLFHASGPASLPPQQKIGSLALAVLASNWGKDSAPPQSNFVVCGQVNAAGLLTSNEETRKAIATVAESLPSGLDCLIVPSDSVPVVRKTIAAGCMTFVTDCIVWSAPSAHMAAYYLRYPAVPTTKAFKEYFSRKAQILQKKDQWRKYKTPVEKLEQALAELTWKYSRDDLPHWCLTRRVYELQEPVGAVESIAWAPETVRAVGEKKEWERNPMTSQTGTGGVITNKPIEGAFAGYDVSFRGYGAVPGGPVMSQAALPNYPGPMSLHSLLLEDQVTIWKALLEQGGVFRQTARDGQPINRAALPLLNAARYMPPDSRASGLLPFIAWWDSAGLVRIPQGRTPEEKVRWLAGQYERETRRNKNIPVALDEILNDRPGLTLKDKVSFGYFFSLETSPAQLAAFARGPVAVSLRVGEFRNDKATAFHHLPVISAEPDGRMQFLYKGAVHNARLTEWMPQSDLALIEAAKTPGNFMPGKSWRLEPVPPADSKSPRLNEDLRIHTRTGHDGYGVSIWWLEVALK